MDEMIDLGTALTDLSADGWMPRSSRRLAWDPFLVGLRYGNIRSVSA